MNDQQSSGAVTPASSISHEITQQGHQLTLRELRSFVGATKDWPPNTKVIGELVVLDGELVTESFVLKVRSPFPEPLMVPPNESNGPHSRACGIRPHEHGLACKMDCPTCHGAEGWQSQVGAV